jgi:hypothetical protein
MALHLPETFIAFTERYCIYVHDVLPPSFGSKFADFSCHVMSFACLCSF